jgi:hypothetical protein
MDCRRIHSSEEEKFTEMERRRLAGGFAMDGAGKIAGETPAPRKSPTH